LTKERKNKKCVRKVEGAIHERFHALNKGLPTTKPNQNLDPMEACAGFWEIVDTSSSYFRQTFETDTTCAHRKPCMEAYQGGVHTVCVCIVIILVCDTNIEANIKLDNATITLNSCVSKRKY
jgi:hypothetical protein